MTEKLMLVANRIKSLREIFGISVDELAKDLSLSSETINNYESGLIDIPVTFLYEVAHKFNVDLTDILTGESPKLSEYCLVRKDRGVAVERRDQYVYQHLAFNFDQRKFETFLVTVNPNQEKTEYNSHLGQEFNYLLEGKLLLNLNNYEITLEAGDSIFFNSALKHSMKALDNKPAKFLAVIL